MELGLASLAVAQAAYAQQVRVRIGVTGHRRNRLRLPDAVLLRSILGVIDLIRRAGRFASTEQLEIVSALDQGCDALAAHAGIMAHCRLHALIPFKPKVYEATFADKAYRPVFRDLLRMADSRAVLPGSPDDPDAAFTAVAAATLARSDLVLTVWDGAPAYGRGGTPEVLQSALERRLPIIWIDAAEDRPPGLLLPSRSGPCPRLESLALRPQPLRMDALRQCLARVRARSA